MINKHYEAINRYNFLTKKLLQEEYVGNGLTDKQIAEKYGMPSKTVVWRKRKKFGIENKFKNKSNQNATKNRKFSITKEKAEQLLEDGKTFEDISEIMGCSILVAKRRFKELGLTREQKQTSSYEYYDVELNEHQKQLIIGSTLGDGTITVSGAYSCSHSIKQKEYFDHKRQVLFNLHSNCSQKYTHSYEWLKKETESVHFTTGCNKLLYYLRDIFYPDSKKVFPYEYLKDNLTAGGLAYWYCDDGSFDKGFSYFHTYGYPIDEQILMQKLFYDKFCLFIRIKKNNSKGRSDDKRHYLSMDKKNSDKFISLIEPYITPSMLRKIGKKPLKSESINYIIDKIRMPQYGGDFRYEPIFVF